MYIKAHCLWIWLGRPEPVRRTVISKRPPALWELQGARLARKVTVPYLSVSADGIKCDARETLAASLSALATVSPSDEEQAEPSCGQGVWFLSSRLPFKAVGPVLSHPRTPTGMTRSDRSAAPDASRLLQSVRQRNEAGVEKALAAGCSVDGSSELDSRPIIAAAASGKVSMTELLIRKGANLDLGSLDDLRW